MSRGGPECGCAGKRCLPSFADKDALLSAVASEGFAEFAAPREQARAKVGTDPWKQMHAGGNVCVQFAEARPKLFDLMFGSLGVGPAPGNAPAAAPADRKAYQQLTEVLDTLVSSGRITQERRAGAESTLWAMIHGLAVLRKVRALREPFNVSWGRMLKFTADALGLGVEDQTSI